MNIDPEIMAALAAAPDSEPPKSGDVLGLRRMFDGIYTEAAKADAPAPNIERFEVTVLSADGSKIPARYYRHHNPVLGPAVVYFHGGGMMGGSVDLYDSLVASYVERSGVSFLGVDYRRTPEVRGSTPLDDSYAGLEWVVENSESLKVDPGRIAVMGDSAGGALAAGAAIRARDRGVRLAAQILIYPMLDDRTTEPNPDLASTATWTYENNDTAWNALLGESRGEADVPAVLAPARLEDASGLAAAYIEIGFGDIFRDEALAYGGLLARHDVDTELHLYPGIVHASDRLAPRAGVTRRQFDDRVRVIMSI